MIYSACAASTRFASDCCTVERRGAEQFPKRVEHLSLAGHLLSPIGLAALERFPNVDRRGNWFGA
jgi:hypothetical protein